MIKSAHARTHLNTQHLPLPCWHADQLPYPSLLPLLLPTLKSSSLLFVCMYIEIPPPSTPPSLPPPPPFNPYYSPATGGAPGNGQARAVQDHQEEDAQATQEGMFGVAPSLRPSSPSPHSLPPLSDTNHFLPPLLPSATPPTGTAAGSPPTSSTTAT